MNILLMLLINKNKPMNFWKCKHTLHIMVKTFHISMNMYKPYFLEETLPKYKKLA